VTGVQTCALPICHEDHKPSVEAEEIFRNSKKTPPRILFVFFHTQ
jgi:hypothetical protein